MTTDKLIAIVASCLLACGSAGAAVYKSVDEQGNVVYTDQQSSNAEEIKNPSPNTIKMPRPLEKPAAEKTPDTGTTYTSFAILSPAREETVRSNPGILSISMELKPGLDSKAGHSIAILVDGYVLIKNTTQTSVDIPDINRGTHTVEAVVHDRSGKSMIKSQSVTFFMKRESLLNKKPPPKPQQAPAVNIPPSPMP